MYDIYVDSIKEQNHVALLNNKTRIVEDLFLDSCETKMPKWGAIYYARIEKIDKKLNSAFVDLGNGQKGLLKAKHIYLSGDQKKKLPSQKRQKIISELVDTGDWMFLQVKAEGSMSASEDIQKISRLTSKIRIAGRTLLYSPNVLGIYSCHWVNDAAEQRTGEKLKKDHEKGGWVIRQMAPDLPDDTLHLEADSLIGMWRRAKDRAREARDLQIPRMVMTAPNAIERSLIDYGRRGINHFEAMTEAQAETAREWSKRFAPDLLQKITVAKFNPQDRVKTLFDAHDIHATIEMLEDEIIYLPSGGNIIIEQTNACTVIDINSGPADTFTTNIEATKEIMRQIRLRNLSGIIICDMINETSKNNRTKISNMFDKSGQHDPADPQMHGFTRLMMAEITRRRRSLSLCLKHNSI